MKLPKIYIGPKAELGLSVRLHLDFIAYQSLDETWRIIKNRFNGELGVVEEHRVLYYQLKLTEGYFNALQGL